MLRLKSGLTGVVVNVDEAAAARLGNEWKPFQKRAQPTKTKDASSNGKRAARRT